MSPQKRRRVGSDNASKELHFETYCITGISNSGSGSGYHGSSGSGYHGNSGSSSHPLVTSCQPDYQIYDMLGTLGGSPPPCHPSTFTFDKWLPADVTLHVGGLEFRAHKNHLSYCCRYFEGMFGNNMRECNKQDITIHGVDDASFRAILTSFYTGFLSVCSECVIRILRTGTFLQSAVINDVCENYVLSHMNLGSVFTVFDVAAELGYQKITQQAVKLICANLGPEPNLFETDEFLTLSPSRMCLLLENHHTNCNETDLANAVFRWAARSWEWYDVHRDVHRDSLLTLSNHEPSSSGTSPGTSSSSGGGCLDDSGIVVSDDYVVELPEDIVDVPAPGIPDHSTAPPAVTNGAGKHVKTYKRRSRSSPRHKNSRERSNRNDEEKNNGSKRKRKGGETKEDREELQDTVRQGQQEIEDVLMKLEFNNMEVDSLRNFLNLNIVSKVPALYHHIRRLANGVQYRCFPERGSKVAISLCYHRCYRSSENPSRTTILYYFHNNRWNILNNTFNLNLMAVKSLVLHDFLYVFGMHKLPGQQAEPRAFRFNQFTGVWKEMAVPLHSFNSNVRLLAFKDTILMIGPTTTTSGLANFQQTNVRILQYTPHSDTWSELEVEIPITNYQLQRYVSSIITHNDLLYYVSKNLLYSFDIDAEAPREREVAVISPMFTDISNYWLFGYQDKIILLGGLCNVQGGGSWQNREVLIYSQSSESWTILQNHKPSPMFEMMSGMIYEDKIYTVSHAAAGGDSIAKIELFDLTRYKWKKGTNLKYESPVHCLEYGLTVGCMFVKPPDFE